MCEFRKKKKKQSRVTIFIPINFNDHYHETQMKKTNWNSQENSIIHNQYDSYVFFSTILSNQKKNLHKLSLFLLLISSSSSSLMLPGQDMIWHMVCVCVCDQWSQIINVPGRKKKTIDNSIEQNWNEMNCSHYNNIINFIPKKNYCRLWKRAQNGWIDK